MQGIYYLRVVMACVFDPLLPGVCLHASCHTPFLDPIVLFVVFYWVEVLVLSHLNFGSIIYFCETEHPLSLLAEAPVHN